MTGIPVRQVETVTTVQTGSDWPARLALAAAVLFSILLLALAWLLLSGKVGGMASLRTDVDGLRNDVGQIRLSQETMAKDIETLRLKAGSGDMLAKQVTDMATSIDRMKTDVRTLSERAESNARVEDRIGKMEKALGEVVASLKLMESERAEFKVAQQNLSAGVQSAGESAKTAAEQSKAVSDRVGEIEREVKDMQRVIEEVRAGRAAAGLMPVTPGIMKPTQPVQPAPAAPLAPAAQPANPSAIPVKLEPIPVTYQNTMNVVPPSTNEPRVQTTTSSSSTNSSYTTTSTTTDPITGELTTTTTVVTTEYTGGAIVSGGKIMSGGRVRPSVVGGPDCAKYDQGMGQPFHDLQRVGPAPDTLNRKVKVSSVGINSAQNAMGIVGLPFDAVGNFFVWIGEGLDSTFTGTKFIPRDQAMRKAK